MQLSIIISSLALAAAVNATARPRADPRPNVDDTRKIWDFVKDYYIKGKVCPKGWDDVVDGSIHSQCFTCGDAVLSIHNGASDVAGYCITNDEFDDIMRTFWDEDCGRCAESLENSGLGVTFGHKDDWYPEEGCRAC